MTDHTNTVYAKNKTELPWQIESGIECDENQIGLNIKGMKIRNIVWYFGS